MKKTTDITAMVMMVCAIFTGFKLHREVHHLHVYDNAGLWNVHIIAGLIVTIALILHCVQHNFWFKNYAKIKPDRKIVTTILFILACFVILSGAILMCGSHSNFISIFHYVTAIAFTLLTICHVAKRWRIFTALFKKK